MMKWLGIAVLVFLAWFLFTQPQAAGDAVHALLLLIQQAFESIATMIKHATQR